MRGQLPDWLPEAVAALSWLVIQPGSGYRERVVSIPACPRRRARAQLARPYRYHGPLPVRRHWTRCHPQASRRPDPHSSGVHRRRSLVCPHKAGTRLEPVGTQGAARRCRNPGPPQCQRNHGPTLRPASALASSPPPATTAAATALPCSLSTQAGDLHSSPVKQSPTKPTWSPPRSSQQRHLRMAPSRDSLRLPASSRTSSHRSAGSCITRASLPTAHQRHQGIGRYVMTGRRYEAARAQPCSVAVAQLGQLSNSAAISALRSSPLIRPLCCW